MKNRKPRRTLQDVRRELIARRIHAFFAWRMALARFWRIDLLWNSIKLRWAYRRREKVLATLLKNRMSPDWQDSRPKKLRRRLGSLPPFVAQVFKPAPNKADLEVCATPKNLCQN